MFTTITIFFTTGASVHFHVNLETDTSFVDSLVAKIQGQDEDRVFVHEDEGVRYYINTTQVTGFNVGTK